MLADVKDYYFGPVAVSDGGSVEFLFKSIADKKLAGIDVNFKTDTAAKLLNTYVFKKYGKPTKVLQNIDRVFDSGDNAYRSSAAYLWRNIEPWISMVLLYKNEEINKQPFHNAELIILKNDIKPASPLNASTSLDRVNLNYSPLD